MFQLLNDSSFVFLPINSKTTNLMENVQQQKSPRTSPSKISELESNNEKGHELKIFKTSKPIKDSKDDRALTSKKSKCDKKEEKHGFFHKFGFGSKSASVSPVKNIISSIPRRSSEIHDETKSRKIQRKNNVEAIEKSSTTKKGISEKTKEKSPKLKVKNSDKKVVKEEAAVEIVENDVDNAVDVKIDEDDKKAYSPVSSYEEEEEQSIAVAATEIVPIPETGTESDARVSQTIIMKKRTLHEAKTETIILPFGNICSSKDS